MTSLTQSGLVVVVFCRFSLYTISNIFTYFALLGRLEINKVLFPVIFNRMMHSMFDLHFLWWFRSEINWSVIDNWLWPDTSRHEWFWKLSCGRVATFNFTIILSSGLSFWQFQNKFSSSHIFYFIFYFHCQTSWTRPSRRTLHHTPVVSQSSLFSLQKTQDIRTQRSFGTSVTTRQSVRGKLGRTWRSLQAPQEAPTFWCERYAVFENLLN